MGLRELNSDLTEEQIALREAARKTEEMIESPLGKSAPDSSGAPIGVAHIDSGRSYSGIGQLLQEHINTSDLGAWEKIKEKIDYTYDGLGVALTALDRETGFGREIKSRVQRRQTLIFKPNLVTIYNIDPETRGPDRGSTTCTEWAFIAALMRWFHDKLNIRYAEMAIAEAATTTSVAAAFYSMMVPAGRRITPEAAIEGKSGDFYGGWGFYFVRKYLRDRLEPGSSEDPMQGHKESVSGTYLPPGSAGERLMVYDLNRIFDDPSKGREVAIPDGVNYRSITLHKAIVGGVPGNEEDRKAYPGCVLINVPKLKVHNVTLFTNAIKNLGIGLYPMEAFKAGGCEWDYSLPRTGVPAIKGGIPHQIWVAKTDSSGFPERDAEGSYVVAKTGGVTATMIDIIQAVRLQDTYMLHLVDAIEAINLDHTGQTPGIKIPEGLVFAGLDPVATDLLCARFIYSNVSLKEALETGLTDGSGGHFPQRVPLPALEGGQIVTRTGYDSPLSRDVCFARAEERGLGKRRYYVRGRDVAAGETLISLQGRLGTVRGNAFADLITRAIYYDVFKMPWDLQQTFFHFLDAADRLTGSTLKKEFLEAFDEDGDGIVTYEEFGKGILSPSLFWLGKSGKITATEKLGYLRGPFLAGATMLKATEALWNTHRHALRREYSFGGICGRAYAMSQMDVEEPDPFCPNLKWGRGRWPSFQLARHMVLGSSFYGPHFPRRPSARSLYGFAFQYADITQNGGAYTGGTHHPDPEGLERYLADVAGGKKPLDFILHIPPGFEKVGGAPMSNVAVTSDPAKVLTASFLGGREVWAGI